MSKPDFSEYIDKAKEMAKNIDADDVKKKVKDLKLDEKLDSLKDKPGAVGKIADKLGDILK